MTSLCILAFFFILGIFLGYRIALREADAVAPEIRAYLSEFSDQSVDISTTAEEFVVTLLCYIRYPLLAFFLGFASVGVLFLPLLSSLFAVFLSYSVCCFAFALGKRGVLTALCLLGFRCAVSLPAFFLLACPALLRSCELLRYSLGLSPRSSSVLFPPSYFYRFFAALLILTAGAVMDPWLSNQLITLLLQS